MTDNEARARELAAQIEADLVRYDWRYLPATTQGYIAAALSAAERRGRIAEVTEWRDRAIWAALESPTAEKLTAVFNARLAALSPETTERPA